MEAQIKQKQEFFLRKCINNTLPVNSLIRERTKPGDPTCKRRGEDAETVEHCLLHCRSTEEVWMVSPVQWDGIAEMRGSFQRWWCAVVEARNCNNGQDHIALTVHILWQIWKARNDWEFQLKQRSPAHKIQKAHKEWIEYEEVVEKASIVSIPEIHGTSQRNEGDIRISVAVQHLQTEQRVGIGIIASMIQNIDIAGWALQERSTRNLSLETAEALVLALIKARETVDQHCCGSPTKAAFESDKNGKS